MAKKSKHSKPLPLRWWYIGLEVIFFLGMVDSFGENGSDFLTFFIFVALMGFFTFRALKASKATRSVTKERISTACEYYSLSLDVACKATDYVAFDTETTGLDPSSDRIIEIGAIKYINDQAVDTFSTLLFPEMSLQSRITELTGITDLDLKNQPRFKDIADSLTAFIGDLPLLAHNANFDASFLASELERSSRTFSFCYIDTLKISRKVFPGIKVHKLNDLSKRFGLTIAEQTHRALDDAALCQKLFVYCKNKH